MYWPRRQVSTKKWRPFVVHWLVASNSQAEAWSEAGTRLTPHQLFRSVPFRSVPFPRRCPSKKGTPLLTPRTPPGRALVRWNRRVVGRRNEIEGEEEEGTSKPRPEERRLVAPGAETERRGNAENEEERGGTRKEPRARPIQRRPSAPSILRPRPSFSRSPHPVARHATAHTRT